MASGKIQGVGSRKGNLVTIRRWNGHPFYKWRALFIQNGKNRDKGFKTKADAETWAEERRRESLLSGTDSIITSAERAAVIDFRDDLKVLGVDLREALQAGVDLLEKNNRSCLVSDLVDRVISERERRDLSDRYLQDLRSRLRRFERDFGYRSVASISRDEIGDWLRDLKVAPVTTNNYRTALAVMFSDAVVDGYIDENPAKKVKRTKVVEGEVGVLTPYELSRLLAASGEDILPVVLIGAFAGVRRSELEVLDWQDIDMVDKHIRIRAKNAKSSRNRLIPILDNLHKWLLPYVRNSGRVWPSNGRKLYDKARREGGFGVPGSESDKELATGLKLDRPWPENALRHSYASYWLAKFQRADELALNLGHLDTKIIFSNYRAIVKASDAENYWAISPIRGDNVISIAS